MADDNTTRRQQAQYAGRERVSVDRSNPSREFENSATERFKRDESIEALASKNKERRSAAEAAEAAAYQEMAEVAANEELIMRAAAHRAAQIKQSASVVTTVTSLRKKSPLSWTGLAAVFTAYVWQFFFAVFSLIGFGMKGTQVALADEGLIGRFVSWVFTGVGVAGESLGLLLWGLNMLLTFMVFIACYLWFIFNGKNPIKSTASFLITATCFALNLLPVTNLFPWLLIWFIYVNISSTLSRA